MLQASCITATQGAINALLTAEKYRGPVNGNVTWGAILMGLIGACLWVLIALANIGASLDPATFE